MLQSVTELDTVLQRIRECYTVLQSVRVLECYRMLHNIKKVLQSITKTNLAHLLGPIFGLVFTQLKEVNNPNLIKKTIDSLFLDFFLVVDFPH